MSDLDSAVVKWAARKTYSLIYDFCRDDVSIAVTAEERLPKLGDINFSIVDDLVVLAEVCEIEKKTEMEEWQ